MGLAELKEHVILYTEGFECDHSSLFLQGPQKSSAVMRLTLEFRKNTVHNVK